MRSPTEKSESLFTLIEKWLERTPFLASDDYNFWEQYKAAVSKMILNDKKIIEVKNNYINSRKNIQKSLNLIKKL